MNKKLLVVLSCDEWYPYYDIRLTEDGLDVSEWDKTTEMTQEDYEIYKGLLLQMERLQDKLGKYWDKAR